MRHHLWLPALLLTLALTACAPTLPPEVPSSTTASAVTTPAGTGSAPTATLPSTPTTPPESPPPPTGTPALPTTRLSPETVGQIAPVHSVGLGGFLSLALGGDALLAGTTAGIARLRLPDLDLVHFEAVGPAYDLVLSPDGALLAHSAPASANEGRTVLRLAADATPLAELRGSLPRFAPDGQTLTTSSPFGELSGVTWLWSAVTGAPIAELAGSAPRFSDDARYIATVETRLEDPSVTRVYPTGGNQPLLEAEGATPAFSPDSSLVAVVQDAQVAVYRLPDGERTVGLSGGFVSAVAFSLDSRELLGVEGPDLIVWDLATGREQRRLAGVNRAGELPPSEEPRFAPRRDTLATLTPLLGDCPPGGARVSATADGAVLYEDEASVSVAYAPDGARVALGRNGQARIVDLASGAVAERDLQEYTGIAFGPDGATLALTTVVSDENSRLVGQVELWDLATGTRRAVLATAPEDFVFALSRLRFSPDGQRVSALARYGCAAIGFSKIITWNTADGAMVSEIQDLPPAVDGAGVLMDSAPTVLAFTPDGSTAAWRDPEGRLVLRRPSGAEQVLKTPTDPTALAFTDDGATLAIGTEAGDVWLLSVSDGALRSIDRAGGSVEALSVSSDATRMVGLANGEVWIWELERGTRLDRWSVAREATEPHLSADGELLLVNTPTGPIFYAAAGGQPVGNLEVPASALTLDPEQRLAVTITGGRALLWGILSRQVAHSQDAIQTVPARIGTLEQACPRYPSR
ncbi:MAG: hypothetical protein SNJ69_07370 [Chloroflexaceae bacterium]